MESALTPENASEVHREPHPIVGIIGGMGPDATIDLMQRVVRATPTTDEVDHIHLIVDNNPKVPSRMAALVEGHGESPAPVLAKMAERLERAGADVLAMPCNTAHTYLNDIRSVVTIPVMDMIGMTVDRISTMSLKYRRVGIVASTAMLNTELYEDAFKCCSLELVYPETQATVMSLIGKVKSGEVNDEDRAHYHQIVKSLVNAGANIILVACTDLSVITNSQIEIHVPVIDALDVLVERIISFVHETNGVSR